MTTFALPNNERIAYLASTRLDPQLFVGGLLVIDLRGRPLEFHCTAPIEISRAQEILFGQSLEAHFYNDCIAVALLAKLRQQPDLVLVNQSAFRGLAAHTELPVALVVASTEDSDDGLVEGRNCYETIKSGRDTDAIVNKLTESVELAEPFDRILEAIREANQSWDTDEGADADAA